MSHQKLRAITDLLVDFGLPAMILLIAGILIFVGRNSELKTVFALSAGWLFRSGYIRRNKH